MLRPRPRNRDRSRNEEQHKLETQNQNSRYPATVLKALPNPLTPRVKNNSSFVLTKQAPREATVKSVIPARQVGLPPYVSAMVPDIRHSVP
jgi:hypothetical protein